MPGKETYRFRLEIKDKYFTITNYSKAEIKITKSVFISELFPVVEIDEINDYLKSIRKKYFDARHHPFAYRLGPDKNNFRANDDGEPSGTSGKPILESIDKYYLTNILIVVTRYFGGVKLGVGGLRRAYSEAALASINEGNIIEKYIYENIKMVFDYEYISPVMNLIESGNFKIINNLSDEKVKLTCEVRISLTEKFKKDLYNITKGNIIIQ
jgi:uncharacterized YigZ family protein